jgi:hypothetical protein
LTIKIRHPAEVARGAIDHAIMSGERGPQPCAADRLSRRSWEE